MKYSKKECTGKGNQAFSGNFRKKTVNMKYTNYIRLSKSVYTVALLDIVLAEDCILDIVP